MTAYRIDYIKKPNPYGRIQRVGGSYPHTWEDSEENVFAALLSGDTFFVQQGLYRANVIKEWGPTQPFLKTVPDNTKLDNLLSLPNFA